MAQPGVLDESHRWGEPGPSDAAVERARYDHWFHGGLESEGPESKAKPVSMGSKRITTEHGD